ncbi:MULTISPECIES: hypothetical protein [unclassified Streptomyces]|uniref:hypothetical protein n=1 Tax=unclassified Streptomyces TaxID=2593676 RepID=UPI0007C5DA9C|nr:MULTISPECIES: hypothetical protein [unclassified Streptomyces]
MTVVRHHIAPSPFGCRWCGEQAAHHGSRYVRSRGMHAWERPTNTQILARMRARRERRLNVKPVYHAATRWVASSNPEEGIPLCGGCFTESCVPWLRVQRHLDRIRWDLARSTPSKPGTWGGEPW